MEPTAAEAAPRWVVSWSAISAVKAEDATANPTETATQAAPTASGPRANASAINAQTPMATPASAQGRRRPHRDRVRSESAPATGPATIPARPPTPRTRPDCTTPRIQPSASPGVFSCSGMSSCSGVSCTVQSANQASVKGTNQRDPTWPDNGVRGAGGAEGTAAPYPPLRRGGGVFPTSVGFVGRSEPGARISRSDR